MAVADDSHVLVPTGCALTVRVYGLASAVLVVWANNMLGTVDAGKDMKAHVGSQVTWYSIEADPHSKSGVGVN